ncbi:beta-lactamase-like protein [Cercophora newfieldiana]|uniref:Beta-lactamase-like protein n=1 Tax=Cercophora newfieldiana TaxID=92897 RepID=A0AA40CNV4_9PEZI|nr:beta-lactamase-like protein [Cercophora newfieldiana]
MSLEPTVHTCFEPVTCTWQYVVADPETKAAVIIDPVLDFDPAKNAISTDTADALLSLVKENGYTITRLIETHAHADHLTAAHYLQQKLVSSGGPKPSMCIGKRIGGVQERFAKRYGIDESDYAGAFDHLVEDDEVFAIGNLEAKAVHLPGHTPDHMGYVIGSNIFCGDSLFNPDIGSARCDFPSGSPHALYTSCQTLFSLPPHFKIYTGHDYPNPADGRTDPVPYTTVATQKATNKHLKEGTTEEEFTKWRQERDSGLAEPRLIHQALQFNIRGGRLPAATEGGDRFLHVPLKVSVGVKALLA